MTGYRAWIVIQSWDKDLEGLLQHIGCPDVKPDTREPISLRCQNDESVELCVAEPEKVFEQIPIEGDELRAITSAPYDEVRRFHNTVFQFGTGRYRILCDSQLASADESPYMRRFLSIRNDSIGVANSPDPLHPIKRHDPAEPNLWLDPQLIELTEKEVAYCFGTDAAADSLTRSFMLPPFRILEDPPLGGTYFNQSLIQLRNSLFELMGPANPLRDPTACTMMRLCDDPLLRDVFIEGGSLELEGGEGNPTGIVLRVENRGPGAEWFRSRFILDPDRVAGPDWAISLARAVGDDIRAMLPDHGLQITHVDQPRSWNLEELVGEAIHSGGDGGTWDYLDKLQKRLDEHSEAWETLWKRVLYKSSGTADHPAPDHDLAERLFLAQAWRPPWECQWVKFDSWRDALREILMNEFTGTSLTPEERVEQWNIEQRKTNFRCRRGRFDQHENVFFLDYVGSYDPDLVLQWRLLLPLWTIISARTLYLDVAERSRLDERFVLA